MKVFHVLGYLAQRYGGPPNVAVNLGLSLQKIGVDVSWWATATDHDVVELGWSNPNLHLFSTHFPHSWYYSPALRSNLAQQIAEADILHLHQVWDYPIYAAVRLAAKQGKPYVVTPHGIFAQPWRYSSPKKKLYLHYIARPLLNRAACIHAIISPELAGFRRAKLGVPNTVIPNGINAREFENLPSPAAAENLWPKLKGKMVVLFLGRLSSEKGLDILIDAWRNVARTNANTILMLAGPDNNGLLVQLEKSVENWNLGDTVFFSGMLGKSEKMLALSRADVYVQPSLSEVIGLSVLEALAAGKPCLITEGCNFPEMAAAGAGKIVPAHAAAITDGLSSLLALNPDERRHMGERGRSLVVENYTWKIAARKMLTVYENILDGKPIPLYPELVD